MARQHDVLFCKIAITNGLVSQQQAQKVLAYCDRREKEGQRRPMIGAVFTKHDLLRSEDVQRINDAVERRLGSAGGGKGKAAGRRGGGRRGRAQSGRAGSGGRGTREPRRGRRRDRKARPRKIDANTLWMGIGTGIVFVAVVVTIVAIYLGRGLDEEETSVTRAGDDSTAEAAPAERSSASGADRGAEPAAGPDGPSAPGDGSGAEGAQGTGEAEAGPVAEGPSDELKRLHREAINRGRMIALVDNLPDRAADYLEKFVEEHAASYEHGGMELRREAEDLIRKWRGEADTGADDDELGELEIPE